MAQAIQERTSDHFLLNQNGTPVELGPGTYNLEISRQEKIVHPVFGAKPFRSLTVVESARTKKPAFGQITAARPDDIRKWETGFVTYNPSPAHYVINDTMGGNFIPHNQALSMIPGQDSRRLKLNEKETFFKQERGMITKHLQKMGADRTKRLELINHSQISTPAPHTHQPETKREIKKPLSEGQRLRQQAKLHQNLRTMASIPEKTIVFHANQIEQELARQTDNYLKRKGRRQSSQRSSPSEKRSNQTTPQPKQNNVNILIGSQAVELSDRIVTTNTFGQNNSQNQKNTLKMSALDVQIKGSKTVSQCEIKQNEFKNISLAETLPMSTIEIEQDRQKENINNEINQLEMQKQSSLVHPSKQLQSQHVRTSAQIQASYHLNQVAAFVENQDLGVPDLTPKSSLGIPSILTNFQSIDKPKVAITHRSVTANNAPLFPWKGCQTNRELQLITADKEIPCPTHYNQQIQSISMKQVKNIINSQRQNKPLTFVEAVSKGYIKEHAKKLEEYQKYKSQQKSKLGPGHYDQKGFTYEPVKQDPSFQNFGTTVDRPEFKLDGEIQTQLGPGFYPHQSFFNNNNVSAPFKAKCRSNNLFSIVLGHPGPSDYRPATEDVNFKSKLWSSCIQAFGQTESRFSASTIEHTSAGCELGPGQYALKDIWKSPKVFTGRNSRNQSRLFRTAQTECTFRSTTERSLANHIKREQFKEQPPIGAYKETRNISTPMLQGGSSNNFSLSMVKQKIGFNSTGQKGLFNDLSKEEEPVQEFPPSSDLIQLKIRAKMRMGGESTLGGKSARFGNSLEQFNFRIGPKTPMPDMCKYNDPSHKSSFTRPQTLNAKFR